MKIDHIGIWVRDIDKIGDFYKKYFKGTATQKYHNLQKKFTSCFIEFPSGSRIELMHRPEIRKDVDNSDIQHLGYVHLSISVGSEADVDWITESLRTDGFEVLDGPRKTGDGFYESVILDPEGNRIELTV